MKFFLKLFFCMVLALTVALSVTSQLIVTRTLDENISREVENQLSQYCMVKYSLQSGILIVWQNSQNMSDSDISEVAEQASALLEQGTELTVFDQTGEEIYSGGETVSWECLTDVGDTGSAVYTISEEGGAYRLTVYGPVEQSGQNLVLVLERDITEVFASAQSLREICRGVYVLVFILATLLWLGMSYVLIRPVKELERATRALAEGHLESRAEIKSQDELGDLGRSFNAMANVLEEKVELLEETAQQRETFVANFAHELKTPLTSIIGYADALLQERQLDGEQARAAAGYIMSEGMRLEAMSFKLLEMTVLKKQDFLLEDVEMESFLRDIRETLRPVAAQRGVRLEVRWEMLWCRMECDLLKTLVLNLADNGMKYGGTVLVITGQQAEERCRLTVEDNGIGIGPEELSQVTEPFYMVDKSRARKSHGAGLGLTLCREIARIHGSDLHIESSLGEGTRVWIELEMSPEPAGGLEKERGEQNAAE